jgi:hypothetical protein
MWRTVIAVAHRLVEHRAPASADRADHGRIVEQGSHAELLAHGDHDAALWWRQSGGILEAPDLQAAVKFQPPLPSLLPSQSAGCPVPEPLLHKYYDFGNRALSNISLRSGERILLSLVPNGFALRRLYLNGLLPWGSLFSANAQDTARIARVLSRGAADLPPLPRAPHHRDDAAMLELINAATIDLKAAAEAKPIPGAVEALDLDNRPERPLSLFSRLALSASDANDLVRRFERTRMLPG